MQVLKHLCLGLLLTTLFVSCREQPVVDNCDSASPSAESLAILPLGDSRVEGASPEFESYRFALWERLILAGWDVDFIGTRIDPAEYPKVQDKCFDNEHEGIGGIQTVGILEVLAEETFSRPPDVVLLGIGGNDVLDQARTVPEVLANIRLIIAELQKLNPSVIIFLEKIAPGMEKIMTAEFTQALDEFGDGVDQIVADLSQPNALIIPVDMRDGWMESFLADDVHYNEAGAQFVAGKYFAAMEQHIDR